MEKSAPPAPLRVGVAGLGTVGCGILDLLRRKSGLLAARAGREIVVAGVSARDRSRERAADLSGFPWFDDPVALAQADGIDCLVEVIGGEGDPALAAHRAAFTAGRDVVTANKALLAHHGHELAERAERAGRALGLEAAVAGGIPVLKGLGEGLAGNAVHRVYGVLNGTCNYILAEMERTGADYETALAAAQKLGYAEADPAFDVGGMDTAHKLAILAARAFGVQIDFAGVSIEGIECVEAIDIEYARSLGFRIRLLGVTQLVEDRLEQRVQPCLVRAESRLGTLTGADNAVVVEGSETGPVLFAGAGAGAEPTASAIAADLIDIARGHRRPVFTLPVSQLRAAERQPQESRQAAYYLRLLLDDRPGVLAQVAATFGETGISIDQLSQQEHAEAVAPVLIVTHKTFRGQLDQALAAIRALGVCPVNPVTLRVEDA